MGRRFDRHIDNEELNALVPSSSEIEQGRRLSPDAVREAQRHVASCPNCSRKASAYRQLVNGSPNRADSKPAAPGTDCPTDVDWHEVAAGLWPEWKALQLIMHAALCDHCGPLLRAATSMNDPTPQAEEAPAWPVPKAQRQTNRFEPFPPPIWRQLLQWDLLLPAVALILTVVMLSTMPRSSSAPLSGPEYATFAVNTHRQHAQGTLGLDVRTDSQQTLNEWFKAKSQFALALPASPSVPGQEPPYRLEGARLVQVDGKTAAYIAYQSPAASTSKAAVSLIVTPDSVAVASGGVQVDFKKVSFHYATVEGFKVVTWSLHGLTYALVSQEGNATQRSCMVCHSAMGDRDLSKIPTPLRVERNAVEPVWQ